MQNSSEFQYIVIDTIHESATNPRRTFDEAKLHELAESIRTNGLIQPITVRPNSDGFEIVAGARRFRAAQLAEMFSIPARIVDISDAQALEWQLVENSQRVDVHPYEEAQGFQRLLDMPGYDVATLVEKSGKSAAHVYARLSLLQLIFITGRRKEKLDEAVKLIGSNVTGVQGDAANLADLDRLYETVKREKGHIDVLFASAGTGEFKLLEKATEEHFDTTFDLNVRGTMFTVQKALPLFREGGAIILNGSIVSIKGTAQFGVYSASKAAVRSLARTWLLELKDRNIRINVLSPGPIDTNALAPLGDDFKAGMAAMVPRGTLGKPEEIATVALFLGSSDSSFVNGVELFVDGGTAQV